MNNNTIKAVDFNDGRALDKALEAAITAVRDVYFAGEGEPSVRELLSMLRALQDDNEGRAAELRAVSN